MEVYAKSGPIFAWSGDDHLTGSSGNDLFVFSQPIGNDMIYGFDAADDKIDLIGYSDFTSFADVQAHMADDAEGNAVITLGDGQIDHVCPASMRARLTRRLRVRIRRR